MSENRLCCYCLRPSVNSSEIIIRVVLKSHLSPLVAAWSFFCRISFAFFSPNADFVVGLNSSCAKRHIQLMLVCTLSHWFLPVGSTRVHGGVPPVRRTFGFQCSRKPLALLVKSPFFFDSSSGHHTQTHPRTYTRAHELQRSIQLLHGGP